MSSFAVNAWNEGGHHGGRTSMSGKNRWLVADEPVEFEQ